jgi:hypothetical protein
MTGLPGSDLRGSRFEVADDAAVVGAVVHEDVTADDRLKVWVQDDDVAAVLEAVQSRFDHHPEQAPRGEGVS